MSNPKQYDLTPGEWFILSYLKDLAEEQESMRVLLPPGEDPRMEKNYTRRQVRRILHVLKEKKIIEQLIMPRSRSGRIEVFLQPVKPKAGETPALQKINEEEIPKFPVPKIDDTSLEHWAFFDCFSGISGDMTLGAFLDLGLAVSELESLFQLLGLGEVRLEVQRVSRQHLSGTHFKITAPQHQPHRTYGHIRELVSQAELSPRVKDLSLKMFRLLAEVEARIHSQPVEEVHFHELGAVDTLADVVGVAYAVEKFSITRVFCSPLPLGWGMIAAAHGRLPNPAPAALELLQGLSLYGTDLPGELVTPTGAVILKALEAQSEPCPPLRLEKIGYGAGSRDLPGHPNLLRLYLGEPLAPAPGLKERVLVLETHIDDMNPELYEPLMAALFAAGALDVALAPIQMKKNRPGVRLTVVAPLAAREGLLERLFLDSTTLGVRVQEMDRVAAHRWQESIDTPYGPLRVKIMEYGGRRRILPEYEACREMAEKQGVPIIEVYRLIEKV